MGIVLNMGVSAAVLMLTLAVQGQNNPSNQPNELRSGNSSQGTGQNTSLQPATQPSMQQVPNQNAEQQRPSQSGTPSTPASSQSTEPKESFSQLALFLFASGLALFIALLGWSDQIRGIDRDTKELEQRFLEKTGIDKRDFLDIVKPGSADEQLVALTQVMTAGGIKTKDSAELLRTFTTYISQWSRLERLSTWKYYLTITLTIALFVAGIASLFITPTQQVRLFVSMRAEMVVLILPMTLIGLLLGIIICSAHREKGLRSLLNSMSDMV